MSSLKSFFIYIFYLIVFSTTFLFVDFRDLTFKTVIPEPKVKINDNRQVGLVKNPQKEEYSEFFEFKGSERDIVDLVNEARKENGLWVLKENEKLNASALEKALHMKENGYFEHVSPQGLNPWYFAQKAGYDYMYFGENLAEGYFSAQSVHEGWMNSPGHRENILSQNFHEIGVGFVDFINDDGQRSFLIVEHFGSRLEANDKKVKIVCYKESKENCEDAEEKIEELEELIEKQEDIIKEAEKLGAKKKDLKNMEDNLDDLKDAEDELGDYLKKCEEYLEKCDEFE